MPSSLCIICARCGKKTLIRRAIYVEYFLTTALRRIHRDYSGRKICLVFRSNDNFEPAHDFLEESEMKDQMKSNDVEN